MAKATTAFMIDGKLVTDPTLRQRIGDRILNLGATIIRGERPNRINWRPR